MYTSIYSNPLPPQLIQLCTAPALRRLQDVGMHCGCEYAAFPIYRQARSPYSRLTHSLGVAAIVWHFTGQLNQAVAGLLHDVATPVFAHTVDFLNHDHLRQESTESRTRAQIEADPELLRQLRVCGLQLDEVADYHLYPIANNDTPQLSADRLEYTLGNAYLVHGVSLQKLRQIYADLTVAANEQGMPELCFQSEQRAAEFAALALKNSRWFVSDEDRFAMQYLADLLRSALERGVLTPEALYATEPAVIAMLRADPRSGEAWMRLTRMTAVRAAAEKPADCYSVRIAAKKRYINPLVLCGGAPRRLSALRPDFQRELDAFLAAGFDRWVYAAPPDTLPGISD